MKKKKRLAKASQNWRRKSKEERMKQTLSNDNQIFANKTMPNTHK